MDKELLSRRHPFLYHLTARENMEVIRRTLRVYSAARLCELGGRDDILFSRRIKSEFLTVNGGSVVIRDQRPLIEKNMDLQGTPFDTFLNDLNSRVFFWAGGLNSPGRYAENHYRRYSSELLTILRIPTQDLVAQADPALCPYNSGAPRWSHGRPSPRGPGTFVPFSAWSRPPVDVVEIVFLDAVGLPPSSEWSDGTRGPWHPLHDVSD